ncbi:MAG TPA: hypothetical protein VN956_04365 [Pyrinomonadaceae bacterium]|nr:hypothetical protein [Pyrinomonadaceae bacterium]
MSTYFNALDIAEGQVHVLTKTRWMGIVPMPHTSVTPRSPGNLKRLGTFVRWTTSDPSMLATLHAAIVRLVHEVGISGLVEVANSVKATTQVARTFGGDWRDIIKQAEHDGVAFPVPDDILKYIKSFT